MRNIYLQVQDLIGEKNLWPYNIRYLLWKCDYSYSVRVKLASFFYLNGLNANETVRLLNFCRGLHPLSEVKLYKLFDYWNDPNLGVIRRSRYFSYDLLRQTSCDLNGNVRDIRTVSADNFTSSDNEPCGFALHN